MKRTTAPARVLVVDDDQDLLDLIAMRLVSAGHDVIPATSGDEAIELFRAERPRVVVSDLRMDGMDGHALFARLHAEAPSVPVIILTAHGTIPDAVAATQRGVFSFLTKPFDGHELLARIDDALAVSPAVAPNQDDAAWRREIVSASAAMDELLRAAHRLAVIDPPVLLTGPRGSGKELLARAMHACGPRARHSFHVHRCGAASDPEEEARRFAAALAAGHRGTLFLDDVGRLPPPLQARLLALVGDGGLFGGAKTDLRVIAANAEALEPAVREGRFRADLFYGLQRHSLAVPALAERREDIPLLVTHFSRLWSETSAVSRGFAPDALALLCDAPWPGNVRQLRNVVERALAQAVAPKVPASLVKHLLIEDNAHEMAAFDEARRAFEYDYLTTLLKATGGNVTRAARTARRNRTEFYKLLARHDIDPARYKHDGK